MFITFKTSAAGVRSGGSLFSVQPGQTVDWPDAGEALRYIASGAATLAPGQPMNAKDLPSPKPATKHRPRAVDSDKLVVAVLDRLAKLEGDRRKTGEALAAAIEERTRYSQDRDSLARDAEAMASGKTLVDRSVELDSAVRLHERECAALDELTLRVGDELRGARIQAAHKIREEASVEVAAIRKTLVAAVESARVAMADLAELHKRMNDAGAPLLANVLHVAAFAHDKRPAARLDAAMLELLGAA